MEQGGENFVSIAAPHFCTYVFMFRWQILYFKPFSASSTIKSKFSSKINFPHKEYLDKGKLHQWYKESHFLVVAR